MNIIILNSILNYIIILLYIQYKNTQLDDNKKLRN